MRTLSIFPTTIQSYKSAAEAIQAAKAGDQQFWEHHRKEDILGQLVRGVSFSDTTFHLELESGKNWEVTAVDPWRLTLSQASNWTAGSHDPIVALHWRAEGEPTQWNRRAAAQRLIGMEISKLFYNQTLCFYGKEGELLYLASMLVEPTAIPFLYWYWEDGFSA